MRLRQSGLIEKWSSDHRASAYVDFGSPKPDPLQLKHLQGALILLSIGKWATLTDMCELAKGR